MLLTRPPLRLKASFQPPLDLHVLSVPPAFILSQDQTLNLIRSLLLGFELTGIFLTVPFTPSFRSFVETSKLCEAKFFLLRCYTVRFSKFLLAFALSCFATFSVRSANCFPREVLVYIITPLSICQQLFSSFFQSFRCRSFGANR